MPIDFDKVKQELNEKYPNIKIVDIGEAEDSPGSVQLRVSAGARELAYFDKNTSSMNPLVRSSASVSSPSISRSPLTRSDLDNVESSILALKPAELFQRSIDYYKVKDVYGTVIRNLTNFASNGFENDIDDDNIKSFFDNWVMDIGIDSFVEQIFFDLFRVGMVRTYKVIGKYEPRVNIYSYSESSNNRARAARKKRWSKSHIPIQYTILNPTLVEISGSLLFNQTVLSIKAEALSELREMLKNPEGLSQQQKEVLKAVPNDMKEAALKNRPYVLDSSYVGEVDYRKQPYERYPMPRGVNAFESIEYKDELRKADLSTLDGITNYILLITVGNDDYPVTNQAVLDQVAELFNTTSKSFDIVFNHTLKVQKIVSPEIESVLGQDKYRQVNDDYTGALGFVRALIDGGGNVSSGAAELAMKSVISEVEYARRMVKRWIYKEYRTVAEAMGFDRYPVVRFNDMELRDMTEMLRIIMGMVDRRMLSYETGIQSMGKDATTEFSRLAKEKELVLNGDLGIIGSPYNPKAVPPMASTTTNDTEGDSSGDNNVQKTQRTPKGTPSEGRPDGSTNAREDEIASLKQQVNKMSQELESLLYRIKKV